MHPTQNATCSTLHALHLPIGRLTKSRERGPLGPQLVTKGVRRLLGVLFTICDLGYITDILLHILFSHVSV